MHACAQAPRSCILSWLSLPQQHLQKRHAAHISAGKRLQLGDGDRFWLTSSGSAKAETCPHLPVATSSHLCSCKGLAQTDRPACSRSSGTLCWPGPASTRAVHCPVHNTLPAGTTLYKSESTVACTTLSCTRLAQSQSSGLGWFALCWKKTAAAMLQVLLSLLARCAALYVLQQQRSDGSSCSWHDCQADEGCQG